ncbi:BF3164 family lipoprotein [Cyclobacterium roseum]|uniref:BF3164 family lipoprotein n=1 Tax=Cyclobacterium roseum TaxID=2666137 RepID=UPI0013919655|nr:BF3164 family lipoprotein [Cyclobacterium roseum]
MLKIHGEHLVVLSGTQLIKIKLHAEKATREAQHTLISDTGGPINGLHLVNDSVYVADIGEAKPGAPEHRLVHLRRNEELVRFGEYPEPAAGENRDQANLSRDYMKSTVANPKDGRLAAFYLYHNQIRLYGGDGELLQQIEVKSSSNSASDEEMWMYRADPFASNERIYVLYIGMPKKEVEENFQTFRPYLEVWDWEGNLLDRFRLDQPITTFTYAEEFKKLYGISFFKEDVLYEYDLNEGGITDSKKESSAVKGKYSKK